jgi:hypothetical protein
VILGHTAVAAATREWSSVALTAGKAGLIHGAALRELCEEASDEGRCNTAAEKRPPRCSSLIGILSAASSVSGPSLLEGLAPVPSGPIASVTWSQRSPSQVTHRPLIDSFTPDALLVKVRCHLVEDAGMAIVLSKVDGFSCTLACDILLQSSSNEELIAAATARCLSDPTYLGFTIKSGSGIALFFSDNGYPLKEAAGHETFLKRVEVADVSEAPRVVPSASVEKEYIYLGGGHHEDTSYFDGTTFLDEIVVDAVYELRKIHVWAGASLVNGFQLVFSTAEDGFEVCSPAISTSHDSPVLHTFSIDPGDHIESISVRYGALVSTPSRNPIRVCY